MFMKSLQDDNIKLLKSFYDAASRGDFSLIRNALDPTVEWLEPNVAGLWFSGMHRGADAVWKEVMEPTAGKIDQFRIKIKKFYPVGDHIVAIGSFHGRGKTTGKELDAATAHVWTLRNGRIVRFEAFHDAASWLETLGLMHPETHRIAA